MAIERVVFAIFICGIFLIELEIGNVFCDVHSSVAGLERLMGSETSALQILNGYIDNEMRRLNKLETSLQKRKEQEDKLAHDCQENYKNLTNLNLLMKFKMLNTFRIHSQDIEQYANLNHNWYYTKQKEQFVPDSEDLEGSAKAIFRIQDTYNVPVKYFIQSMNANDCFYLGYEAMKSERHDLAILWLVAAEKKTMNETDGLEVTSELWDYDLAELYKYLASALYGQKNYEWSLWYMSQLSFVEPDDKSHKATLEYLGNKLVETNSAWDGRLDTLPPIRISREAPYSPRFEQLCRGEKQNSTYKNSPELYCFFKKNTAYLKLAPIKVEILHREPDLLFFHEILTDKETNDLIEYAKYSDRMKRALVINPQWKITPNASYLIKHQGRLSKLMGIYGSMSEHLSKRVTEMTDLKTTGDCAEPIQIQNYGLAGHNLPHYDMSTAKEYNVTHGQLFDTIGNRIATMLFYLSEPLGGATAFDHIGVTVFPKKNSAAFWYNLLQNGEPDLRTHHGGCPVLSGQKWVVNLWTHERGQEFVRPCALDESK